MKQFLSLAAFVALIGIPVANAQQSGSWKNYKSLEKIDIDYTRDQCGYDNDPSVRDFYLLRLTNKTSQNVQVTLRIDYYFGGRCTSCDNSEYVMTFNIPANSSIQPKSGCELSNETGKLALYIGSANLPNKQVLEKFELSNIVVL